MNSTQLTRREMLAMASAAALVSAASFKDAFAETAPASLAADPRRPQYHLLPAANWMNDPNGPIYWKGRYHMFFQYNPGAAVWGDMHWAHAISPDMIHWKHLPVALAPTPGGPDADGCFSGTAVVRNGVPTFIYTGVVKAPENEATIRDGIHSFRESQCYATSSDPELRTWTKRKEPIIAAPPKDLVVTGFRDPAPWQTADGWYMAVGSGIKDKGGAILLYKSPDLEHWEYQHLLTGGVANATHASELANPVDSGDMWECPDFFSLGNKHVLIYSTQGKVFWQTGTLDTREMTFHSEQSGLLDYGSFYAPKTQLDKAGNRILWGWIQETRPSAEYSASGWSGLMSLPRVLTLGSDGRVKFAIAPAVEKLRQHELKMHLSPLKTSDATGKQLVSNLRLKDACGQILCEIKPGNEPFTLDLLNPSVATPEANPKATTQPNPPSDAEPAPVEASFLSIRYSHANPKELVVDQQRLPINLANGESMTLNFYIDGSVIELLVNNQVALTKRFYYPGKTAPEIAVNITGNQADITRLSMWQFNPISKDRLTT